MNDSTWSCDPHRDDWPHRSTSTRLTPPSLQILTELNPSSLQILTESNTPGLQIHAWMTPPGLAIRIELATRTYQHHLD